MPDPLIRPVTEADLDDLLLLVRRTESHDRIPRVLSREELVDDLSGGEADMATDSRLVVHNGDLAGYVHTLYLPSDAKLERCYLFGLVAPEHRRLGLGSMLLSWAIERAAEQLRSSGSDLPKFIRIDNYDFVESFHRLAARTGFEPVRYFDQLLRPLTDLPPRDRAEVAGISLIRWPVDRNAEIRAIKNTAFADHWGSTPTTEARWEKIMTSSTVRFDWSWVALNEDGDIVGYCLNERYEADDDVTGRSEAWIGNIGTLREYRGRGIASALMIRSLHDFAAEGLSHAILGVDSDSPTGAPSVYRNLGFQPHTRTITHEIRL